MQLRHIEITEDYLHIPVRPGLDPRCALQIWLSGTLVREFYLSIEDDPAPQHFFFLDVSIYKGKTLTFILPNSEHLNPGTLERVVVGGAPTQDNPMYQDLYKEPLRAQFHFSSKRGWLNDPNGLLYANGLFHLYYQHNPMGTDNGSVNICWGHATSNDLIHWEERNDAIAPWRRDATIASGSAMVDSWNAAGYGEGAIIAAFTALGARNEIPGRHYPSGGQFLAASIDGGNTFYFFNTQATVPTENGEGWRDPRIFRYEDHFVMAVYETESDRNCVSLYTSKDLHNWTRTSRNMDLYECPDLFPLTTPEGETRWVLYGADGFTRIGDFDGEAFTESGDAHPLDYGKAVYAGQTWNHHPEGKRVHISWILGMDGIICEDSFPGMPFSQCMSIPCELTIKKMGDHFRVLRNPVAQVETLRQGAPVESESTLQGKQRIGLQKQGEYIFTFSSLEGALTITAGTHPIVFDPAARELRFDNGRICAIDTDALKVRLLVDTTTMEFFFDDGVPATYTIHPDNMSLEFEGKGHMTCTKWAMKSIWNA